MPASTPIAARLSQPTSVALGRAARATLTATVLASMPVLGLSPLTSQAATTAAATAASAPAKQGNKQGAVTQVQATEVKGQGSGAGMVAGAVVGGLLGNRVGKGSGNALATVGGAVAGGYAGNEIEKHAKKHVVYTTTVKFDDGSTQTYSLPTSYALGTRVELRGKRIHPVK